MAKITRAGGRLALELPEKLVRELGLSEGGEISFYELRKGVYVLAKKDEKILGEIAEEISVAIGEKELAVVKKLEAIRFDQRTPKKVGEALSDAEKRVLDALVSSKVIEFFKSAKYKEGVYSIPRDIYKIARGEKPEEAAAKPAAASAKASFSNPEEALERAGYVIVEREGEAKALSERLGQQIKKGEIMGVRGFDKRFYLARKGFYVSASERIEKAMKGGKDRRVEDIAKDAKLKNDECEAVLNIMREEGEVVEKKRGTYALA